MKWSDIQGWFNYEELFDKVVELLPDNSEIVEIGCWRGKSTAYLCEKIKDSGKNIKLNCVDIWDDSIGVEFHKHSQVYQKFITNMENGIFEEFRNNMKQCGVLDMINIIKSDSVKASELFENKSLDFCFVDGDHSYEGADRDIRAWFPKMKSGSIFCGHDYVDVGQRRVKPVVDNFAKEKGLIITKVKSCWWTKIK